MYFLFTDDKDKRDWKVENKQDRYILVDRKDNIEFRAFEVKEAVKYFICKETDGKFYKKDFEEAILMRKEIFVDVEEGDLDKEIEYEDIINEFGDKRRKEALKKRALENAPVLNVQKIKYNTSETLVKSTGKNMSIEGLFEKEYVDKSKELVNAFDSSEIYEKIIEKVSVPTLNEVCGEDDEQIFTKKCILVFLDYFYDVLLLSKIEKSFLSRKYEGFYKLVHKYVANKKLSLLGRDKIVSKFYSLILLYCNGKIHIDKLPRMKYSKTKYINLIRSLGCVIDKKGEVKLV